MIEWTLLFILFTLHYLMNTMANKDNLSVGRPSKKFKTLEAFHKLTFVNPDTFRKKTKKELGLYPY